MNVHESILREFGEGSDEEQAEFINQLARALTEACRFDHGKTENQHCYMARKLNATGQKFVENLAEFVRLQKENA